MSSFNVQRVNCSSHFLWVSPRPDRNLLAIQLLHFPELLPKQHTSTVTNSRLHLLSVPCTQADQAREAGCQGATVRTAWPSWLMLPPLHSLALHPGLPESSSHTGLPTAGDLVGKLEHSQGSQHTF